MQSLCLSFFSFVLFSFFLSVKYVKNFIVIKIWDKMNMAMIGFIYLIMELVQLILIIKIWIEMNRVMISGFI